MNLKPFNLEKALAGEPVVTRDGIPVTEIHYFKTSKGRYPVVAIINGEVVTFQVNGQMNLLGNEPLDLLMAPVKREKWVNIYENPAAGCGYSLAVNTYSSEAEAKAAGNPSGGYVKSVLIDTWEE